MSPYSIIAKKKAGQSLTNEEINFFVQGYTGSQIPDYQMAALLMAIVWRGMNLQETVALTGAMRDSGEVLDLSSIPGAKIDKHSTGGVGDKVSIVLAPLVAACGVVVPMISGRGLGHTGGTLDKLAAIPGFNTQLGSDDFKRILKQTGVCLIGQTESIAPADKKMYALRDVTATVDSIPLICSSIMSKKLASGTDGIVFDVKVGKGAFMSSKASALKLAKSLVAIGEYFGKKTSVVLTDMNEPLGWAVGNTLETIEAIECLKGRGPKDLMEITLTLGASMLRMAGIARNDQQALLILNETLQSGRALNKLREVIAAQGGNPRVIEDYALFPKAKFKVEVVSPVRGYLEIIDTYQIGKLAVELGAGRKKMGDEIDPAVGFLIHKKVGDRVNRKERLATIIANDRDKGAKISKNLKDCLAFTEKKVPPIKKVVQRLDTVRGK